MPVLLRPTSVAALCVLFLALGCAPEPVNPSFPVTHAQADSDLNRIEAARKPLDRPLVIIGGFTDPGLAPTVVRMRFDALTSDKRIIDVELGTCLTFDECRAKVIDAVDRAFPNTDPAETTTVDVIGLSMGGLTARYAAMPDGPGHPKRLRIARLFTISSPLDGARMADEVPALLPLIEPMRRGSKMLNQINALKPDYSIYSYVRLGDNPVGPSHAAPPGQTAWWLSTPPLSIAHTGAMWDPRILADIARRLRGEMPFATEPRAPPLPA